MILPKLSGYIKAFKVQDADKDKYNKLMYFHIDDEKLLKKKLKPFGLTLKT